MDGYDELVASLMKIDTEVGAVSVIDEHYKRAGGMVDGLEVNPDVPNTESIGSSLDEYKVLKGTRVVSVKELPGLKELFYAADDVRKGKALAEEIKQSGYIKPLIVVVDKDGPYILEGAHRTYALLTLGKTEVPALIVVNLEDYEYES